ncbi:MAG: hypothetical protein ACOC10_12385 [Bacteroidota bacterium]
MNLNNNIRPDFLSALCLLTFFGSGVAFFGYFLAAIFFDWVSELIIEFSAWHSVEQISPVYFTALMALSAMSLTGAIRMWKLHRDGFYLYLFAQISILLLPVLWIDATAFSVSNAIFTAVFITGYSLNFSYLK